LISKFSAGGVTTGLLVIHSISRAMEAALLIENQQSGTVYFYFAECRV